MKAWIRKQILSLLPQYEYESKSFQCMDHVQWETKCGWEVVHIRDIPRNLFSNNLEVLFRRVKETP